jgi:hypothetical protein
MLCPTNFGSFVPGATKNDDLRSQEPFYFRQRLVGHLFRQPVPGWQGFA